MLQQDVSDLVVFVATISDYDDPTTTEAWVRPQRGLITEQCNSAIVQRENVHAWSFRVVLFLFEKLFGV